MKKPEIDAYGWINGKYYDDLSEVINPLIDALVSINESDMARKTMGAMARAKMIEALHNVGVDTENP